MLVECKVSTLHCYVQENRNLKRIQENGEPIDAPYTSTTDYKYSIECISNLNKPLLMLLRHDGTAKGWGIADQFFLDSNFGPQPPI